MHNLTKIKLFRLICRLTYIPSLIFIYPFALLKRKNTSPLFFFFDRYSIGGAQRIHLDILESVKDIDKQIYFTRHSDDATLKESFYSFPKSTCRDIHFWCDNLLFRPFTVHFYAFYINRHLKAHVFSSNSTFFYDMLPFLREHIIKTELLHNFTQGKKGMEFFGLANYSLLSHRFIYDNFTLRNIKEQYQQYNIPEKFLERIVFLEPGVEVPAFIQKDYSLPLQILYAGRGGAQKRIHLLNRIAEHCIDQKWRVVFHFAGTMVDELSEKVKNASVLHGQISEKEAMNCLYEKSHIILMTSAYEGFPMLIKESMAYGCVPVVTALEGNKMHLFDGENALLINEIENEKEVVSQGIQKINELVQDRALLQNLSNAAHNYARNKFSREKFIAGSRKLLLS